MVVGYQGIGWAEFLFTAGATRSLEAPNRQVLGALYVVMEEQE